LGYPQRRAFSFRLYLRWFLLSKNISKGLRAQWLKVPFLVRVFLICSRPPYCYCYYYSRLIGWWMTIVKRPLISVNHRLSVAGCLRPLSRWKNGGILTWCDLAFFDLVVPWLFLKELPPVLGNSLMQLFAEREVFVNVCSRIVIIRFSTFFMMVTLPSNHWWLLETRVKFAKWESIYYTNGNSICFVLSRRNIWLASLATTFFMWLLKILFFLVVGVSAPLSRSTTLFLPRNVDLWLPNLIIIYSDLLLLLLRISNLDVCSPSLASSSLLIVIGLSLLVLVVHCFPTWRLLWVMGVGIVEALIRFVSCLPWDSFNCQVVLGEASSSHCNLRLTNVVMKTPIRLSLVVTSSVWREGLPIIILVDRLLSRLSLPGGRSSGSTSDYWCLLLIM